MKLQLLILFFLQSIFLTAQNVFTESIGVVTSTTSLLTHETNNGFDNDGFTMDKGGALNAADIRTTSASFGYVGASGTANVWFTNTSGEYGFAIKGINTSLCSSLALSFAVRKESAAGTAFATLALEYSTDSGITWNNLVYTAPASTSGAGWYLIPAITLPSGAYASDLWLRWRKTGTIACRLDDIKLTGNCSVNSITTGALTGTPVTVSCTNGSSGAVAFTSSGTFLPGNGFNVQLSNAAGSFVAPVVIGSLDSASSVGTNIANSINFNIPSGIPSGNYKIRVISTNPVLTGSETTSFTITLSNGPCGLEPPYMSSAIINSCGSNCFEGHNELIFGNTGDYSVMVSSTTFKVSYGAFYPLTCYTDVLTTNPFITDSLNTVAGCPGTFVEGVGTTIPPGASFIVAPFNLCSDAINWSGLCGNGPIYMIYQNDPDWNYNGTFKNGNTGGIRYFNTTITSTTNEEFSVDYNYNSTLLQSGTSGDGDYVSFTSSGGAATYGDNNCVLTPVLLPTSVVQFSGVLENGKCILDWSALSEQNNSHYTLLHSSDGEAYEVLSHIQGAGNSSELIAYRYIHENVFNGLNYYQLKSTDFDGKTYLKGEIAIANYFNFAYYDFNRKTIVFNKSSDIQIFAADGRIIFTGQDIKELPFEEKGIFLLKDSHNGILTKIFVP
jgi:hypothetical protein